MIKQGETPETDALWVDDVEIPSVKKVTELCRSLERRLHAAEKDARRYRWLRDRVQVRHLAAINGRVRPALCLRAGFEFLETKTDPKRGWTDIKYFDEMRETLDAAIDAEIDK